MPRKLPRIAENLQRKSMHTWRWSLVGDSPIVKSARKDNNRKEKWEPESIT